MIKTWPLNCPVCGKEFRTRDRRQKYCCHPCSSKMTKGRPPSHGGVVGGKLSTLYKRWSGIKRRCTTPSCNGYENYGGRGISMCDEWLNSFPAFEKWANENGFKPELQIDRIDNYKGYSPDNCRWVTPKVNQANRRNSIIFPSGETTAQVAERLGMSQTSIRERLRRGVPMHHAMILPWTPRKNRSKPLTAKLYTEPS